MNVNALTVFLVVLGELLAITIFFYGGRLVLHWLETTDPKRSPSSFFEDSVVTDSMSAAGQSRLLGNLD